MHVAFGPLQPRLAALLALALLAPAGSARADTTRDQAVVSGVAGRFLAPAYAGLAAAATADAAAWRVYCPAPDATGLAAVQAAHRRLALAYGAVQAFRFGPVGENGVAERLYFWPERKNAGAKGLAALLAGSDPITPERVARASAAAQGIPALERLAYADPAGGPEPPVAVASDAGKRACAAATAIAANVAAITASVSAAWGTPETGYAARLARGDLDPALSVSMQQAAAELVTGFMTGLAVIQDQKLEPVLGASPDDARPAAAEARRSGLTREMILANIEGLRAFVAALDGAADPVRRRSWDALLVRVDDAARALADFPDGAGDPVRRRSAEALLARLKSVRALLQQDLPAELGLTLGFNGLDGD